MAVKRLLHYAVWTVIWLLVFGYLKKMPGFITITLVIAASSLLKDVFIDVDLFKVFHRKGPWPDIFEHFPLSVIIALSYSLVGYFTAAIAAVDAVVDFLDDQGII